MTDAPPHWLVIGAPKAGTTTLAGWLGTHPQVCLADTKEVDFFRAFYDRGVDWYRAQFSRWQPGLLAGEATPTYLYSDAALDRIRSLVPDVRLVVVLREHSDRLWSHHWYVRATGMDPRPLGRALRAEDRGSTRTWGAPVGYLEASEYAGRLRAVLDRFDRGQLLVTFFDDLRERPAEMYAEVCRHIGVTDHPLPLDAPTKNVGRRPRSAWLQWARWHQPLRWLPERAKARMWRMNLRAGSYPPMPADLRAALHARFAPDRAALVELLGRPLPPSWPAS